jgi:exonuclease SbcD
LVVFIVHETIAGDFKLIRVLHTADWHIGHTLRGYSRESEHLAVFDQLVKIVTEREVDVVLIAGDIFDSQNPSGEAQQLFYRTLGRLRSARPGVKIVVIAGHHDAASRLEAPSALLTTLDMHVIGSVRRVHGNAVADRHLIPIHDASGHLCLNILAVSHPTAGCLPNLTRLQDESGSLVVQKVSELYADLYQQLEPQLKELPFIVTGHLHVLGGDLSESSERRILVGGEHAVPHTVFPEQACYVALGHLHRAQRVGADQIRYSGSLFPLSASEYNYQHSVTLVTIAEGRSTIEQIPLARPVPFLRLPATGTMSVADLPSHLAALQLPADLPVERRPFVQAKLKRDELPVGFREELDRLAEPFPVRMLEPSIATSIDLTQVEAAAAETLRSVADHQPEELFRLAFEHRFEREPSAEQLDIFHRIEAEVDV